MKEIRINAIREGTVIDHIPAEYTFKVAEILKITHLDNVVSVASNLKSRKLGKKGIIKVEFLDLKDTVAQKIALIAPNATLSTIKNFEVIEKKKLDIPQEIYNIVKCFNPNCITNNEKVKTKFLVESKKPLAIRCYHCERFMTKEDIELL